MTATIAQESELSECLAHLHKCVMEELDEKYELVYVNYDEKLTDEQVSQLVSRDHEVWDSLDEWSDESSWMRATLVLDDHVRLIANREFDDPDTVVDAYHQSEDWYEAVDTIQERDDGDWMRQLVRNTGRVLLRIPIKTDFVYEFTANDNEDDVTAICLMQDLGLPITADTVKCVTEILAESGTDTYAWGFWLAAFDLEDLYTLSYEIDEIDIVNPHLFLTNVYAGDGWEQEFPMTVRVKVEDLRTDGDAQGYSWTEIAGPYVADYECEFRPVTN